MFNTLIFLAFLGREQPPSRGCVLKLTCRLIGKIFWGQPPSRGCVLKRKYSYKYMVDEEAAAFARLCVETRCCISCNWTTIAAAFARLCVETSILSEATCFKNAAAFARLCVETVRRNFYENQNTGSRLRAAVCWNLMNSARLNVKSVGSRLRAAVCWNIPTTKLRINSACSRLRAAVCWNK